MTYGSAHWIGRLQLIASSSAPAKTSWSCWWKLWPAKHFPCDGRCRPNVILHGGHSLTIRSAWALNWSCLYRVVLMVHREDPTLSCLYNLISLSPRLRYFQIAVPKWEQKNENIGSARSITWQTPTYCKGIARFMLFCSEHRQKAARDYPGLQCAWLLCVPC